MIIGMLPMAIEPGQNAPLGRAAIGGLMFGTCATLILVSALFSIAHGRERPEKAYTGGSAAM
jgi:multidrug efflux pump subunit AcrB